MAGEGRETPWVIEEDSTLPAVQHHPAPWQLRGSAYLVAVRLPPEVVDREAFVPPALVERRRGRTAFVMYVDYEVSNCGPYQELLFAPGSFAFPTGVHPSLTRMYVSTYESVVNGRLNWGIPKDRADFDVRRDGRGDLIRVGRDGHTFAELQLRAFGPPIPVLTGLVPKRMRTVVQLWHGKTYRFSLNPVGSMRLAKVDHWRFETRYFPDLTRGRVLFAAEIRRFELTFPVADVSTFPG